MEPPGGYPAGLNFKDYKMRLTAKRLRLIIREEVVHLINEDRQFSDTQKKARELAMDLRRVEDLLALGQGKQDLQVLRSDMDQWSAKLALSGADQALFSSALENGNADTISAVLEPLHHALRLASGERVDAPQAPESVRAAVPPGQERPEYVPGPSQGFIGGR